MANSRPSSMIISSNVLDETNTNGSKSVVQKKDSLSIRSSNQAKLPGTNIPIAHSSSSSIDSTGAKLANLNEKISSLPQMNSLATVSSTTTDSELESEQEERYTDDNNSLELNNLPKQSRRQQQQHQDLSRRDSGQQKSEGGNTSEQLSRRVKHFQKLFKSEIADDDMPELIDSYVCAYQGDILLQGKMYITDRYLCFHSRIISYVTKHVYRWEQIENVTKERVAFIFPTAIGIQLKPSRKKVIYASFLQRDQAYDKIISICSRFNNETNSIADDDDNRLIQSGTLKSSNSNHNYSIKTKKSKHNNHYETPDESEHDNVLQMCLGHDRTNSTNKRRVPSTLVKQNDDKQQQQQTKKLFNSDKKKNSSKNSTIDSNLSSDLNGDLSQNDQSIRSSIRSKTQQKQTDTISSRDHQSHRTPSKTRQTSRNRDRTLSPSKRSLSTKSPLESSSNLLIQNDLSNLNFGNSGFVRRYFRIILLSIISIIKLFLEYLSLLFNQFKIYPIKTSFVLLIFVIILVIHSFYLIKLAYRIENRLQSLHHVWPSSMKNSLPSSKEFS